MDSVSRKGGGSMNSVIRMGKREGRRRWEG